MNGFQQFIRGLVLSALIVFCATLAIAQTGGPAQPEFSNFEPVSTEDMVNPFDGSFTYNIPLLNIPGPDGSGYSVSLSYHSGNTQESQASWVGYGWTLNPGSITRDLRGFPDDCNGSEVRYWNKTGKNITGAVTATFDFEAFSMESESPLDPAHLTDMAKLFQIGTTLRYNNHKGFGYSNSITSDLGISKLHPMAEGIVSLGYSVDDGAGSFQFQVNPGKLLSKWLIGNRSDASISETFKNSVKRFREGKYLGIFDNSVYSFSDALRPVNTARYTGASFNVSGNLQVTGPNGTGGAAIIVPFFFPVGIEFGLQGNYTYQENIPSDVLKTYGYLYLGNASSADMMDYYAEKEAPYSKRDQFLSIPFSNADNFTLSGEGVGGGFRAFAANAGHFRPNAKTSSIDIGQLGFEFHAGSGNFGVGVDLGYGHHSLDVERWDDDGINNAYAFSGGSQPHAGYFFRFNNDLGGGVSFSGTDDPVRAAKTSPLILPTVKTFYPTVSPSISPSITSGAGQSSYLGFHTNREMMERSDVRSGDWNLDNVFYNSYNKDGDPASGSRRFVDRSDVPDGIGEFQVVNAGGMRYVYGLPVYSRKEKNLSFGLQGLAAGNIVSNYIAKTSTTPSDAAFAVGEERNAPYASTFLLTEITTADYVDRTNDGPTPDDYGGYTKFNYRRTAGSDRKSDPNDNAWGVDNNDWYKWRMPYTGLLYDRHTLSDPLDDQGALASGEKEIYYLESIETKTHIAKFITNTMASLPPRKDGYEAAHIESAAMSGGNGSNASRLSNGTQAGNKVEYLDRIELYAKNPDGTLGELLQVVHMQYDYSLCRNLPNAFWDPFPKNAGKLTLRKVWSDYGAAKNAEISPYTFDYKYRQSTDYDLKVRTEYPAITGFGDRFYTGFTATEQEAIQNPEYSPFNPDRWGFYQHDGDEHHEEMRPWVSQSADPMFDPAAWELKRIVLPSGGEIHVQYEQNDYAYVQDEPAMAMVSLKASNTPEGPDVEYSLNLDDLGIITDPNDPAYSADEIIALRDRISKRFKEGEEKIFFKYLYSLTGNYGGGEDPLRSCKSEYIEGYVRVKDVLLESPTTPTGIKLVLGASQSGYDIPRDVCLDFVQKERGYNVITSGDCDGSSSGIRETGPESFIRALWGFMGLKFLDPAVDCIELDRPHSYLRIPLTRPKLGGGIRVKRLLTYDPGIETGDAALFGEEFLYRNRDGSSSGVATNEPSVGREENALVKEIRKRENQNGIEEIISGEDREQFEGPIGESILPAPSIGYGRVVAQDIHRGFTTTGFTVHEFNTARDYPFGIRYKAASPSSIPADQQRPAVVEKGTVMTPMDDEAKDRDWVILPLVFFNYSKSNIWLTQGYSFVLNHMHGQPKRRASYQGTYDPTIQTDNAWALSTLEEYDYFAPGEPVPLFTNDGDIGKGPGAAAGEFKTGYPGREEEVIFESRWVADDKHDGNVETDGSIGIPAPAAWVPFVTLMPSYSYSTANLRTHVTTKVVRYPALVRKMRTFNDGIYETVENLAFDPASGAPVVTRSYDGYNGLTLQGGSTPHNGEYRAYRFPANDLYDAMGQKAESEHAVIQTGGGMTITKKYYADVATSELKPYLSLTITDPALGARALARLSPGDQVRLTRASDARFAGLYHVGAVNGAMISLIPTSLANDLYLTTDVNIEIINSGRTNQLSDVRATISTYGEAQPVAYAASNAQSDPNAGAIHDARAAMVTKLNTVLATLQASGISGASGVSFTDDYSILDVDGTCRARTAGQAWVTLTKTVSGGNVSLDIESNPRKTSEVPTVGITFPVNSHPLVADLNAMLDKAWALEVQDLAVYQNNGAALTTCAPGDCPSNTEPPVFKITMAPVDAPAAKTQMLAASTVDAVKGRSYQIAGATQNGSAILATTTADIGSDLIVDRVHTIAKAGRFDIVITDPDPTHAGDKLVFSLTGSVKDYTWGTTPYDPNAYGVVSSNPAEAGYAVTTTLVSAYANGPNTHWYCVEPFGLLLPLNASCAVTFNQASPPSPTHEQDNLDLFAFYDKSHIFTQEMARFGNDADGYLTINFFDQNGCVARTLHTGILLFTVPTITEHCVTRLAASNNGSFELDPVTWEIRYRESLNSDPIPVPCLALCDNVTATRTLTGVIDASAATFSDTWTGGASELPDPVPGANDYETGLRGKWRPDGIYIYRTDIIGGSGLGGASERTFANAGVYNDFTLFNFDGTNNSPKWLRPETVTRYSPNGQAVERHDIAGIYSAMRFSKSNRDPIAVASNATYDGIMFESFEDGAGNAAGTGHAGTNSLELAPASGSPVITGATWTSQMSSEGAYLRIWSKVAFNNDLNRDLVANPNAPFFKVFLRDANNTVVKTIGPNQFTRIAQTGEWSLYMVKLTDAGSIPVGDPFTISFDVPQQALTFGSEPQAVWLDDVRVEPVEAAMRCYVYDPVSSRLVATFDDQHFGIYFQYNDEGKLIRKIRETINGLQTIEESQYHSPVTPWSATP